MAAAGPQRAKAASEAAERAVEMASASLGDTTVSRATVVADAGVIVFREGLEAVLILAAITASFTGARRRLRRPVLLGALAGLLATAITYVLAQQIVQALGDGGLRLQAITGLLAIAVLLLVTNWFFHRIYWSEWISRFNRRRKHLERIDRLGFISGQTAGFLLLGLTSVYREGFETVLFLQNLQVSAGTGATILGVAIGLGATLAVGTFTFALERKLHYRRMLIVTGVLIGVVLAIMTGTTIHTLQGLGWVAGDPDQLRHPPGLEPLAGPVFDLGGDRRPGGRDRGRVRLLRRRPWFAAAPAQARAQRPFARRTGAIVDTGSVIRKSSMIRLQSAGFS